MCRNGRVVKETSTNLDVNSIREMKNKGVTMEAEECSVLDIKVEKPFKEGMAPYGNSFKEIKLREG